MNQLASRGIILRRIEYGEADRIITMLTSDYGKVRLMAKGVRKQKSKLAGGIELFSVSEIHFIKGRGDIDTLVSTRMLRNYGTIVKDLSRTDVAYLFLRAIDRLVEDGTGSEYFDVLDESLAAVNDIGLSVALAEASFWMRVLQRLGAAPDFGRDTSGGRLAPGEHYVFDYEAVSFRVEQNGPFNQNHLKFLRLVSLNSLPAIRKIVGAEQLAQDVLPLVRSLAGQAVQL